MEATKKLLTPEEIKKISPGYRGKPEDFNPELVGKIRRGKKPPGNRNTQTKTKGPTADTIPPPKELEAKKPTPQRNTSMLEDSIFSSESPCRELLVHESITPSFARVTDIVERTYANYVPDAAQLNKTMTKEMLMYYTTALLWARIIDVKGKNARIQLTPTEVDYLASFKDKEFNVPYPIAAYLCSIGNYKDKTGKTVYLSDHSLPVSTALNKTGYHSAVIDINSHNLFEEIPSLGIVGDTLIAVAGGVTPVPAPTFGPVPAARQATNALCGYFGQCVARKEEIVVLLNSLGITGTSFFENVTNARLNTGLLDAISAYLGSLPTFRVEKLAVDRLSLEGEAALIITTCPTTENVNVSSKWIELVVTPYCSNRETETVLGSTYYMGFQLKKEEISGSHQNWCCLRANERQPIEPEWIANRNVRRAIPSRLDERRFSSIADSMKNRTESIY